MGRFGLYWCARLFSSFRRRTAPIGGCKNGLENTPGSFAGFFQPTPKTHPFTEIGYKSTKDAGISPWAWPERLTDEERKQIFSEETQATLYQAMMEETMNAPFVAGIHLWKWYPKYGQLRAGRRRNSTLFNIDFTPQGKQAEAVMSKYFGLFKN